MAIIHSISAGSHYVYDEGYKARQITLEEHVADLRSKGARVELFDAPRRVYGGASSSDIEAVGYSYHYEGAVLATGERNGYDDSDFYAVVWDDVKGKITTVDYDTTRGGGGGNAVIDATDEAQAKANAYLEAWAYGRLVEADRAAAAKVEKGRRVRVKKGRTAPVGVEGTVFWVGEARRFNHYGPASVRIGIATSDRKDERGRNIDVVWSYAHNVEVLDQESYYSDDATLRARATSVHGNWRAIHGYYSALAGQLVA